MTSIISMDGICHVYGKRAERRRMKALIGKDVRARQNSIPPPALLQRSLVSGSRIGPPMCGPAFRVSACQKSKCGMENACVAMLPRRRPAGAKGARPNLSNFDHSPKSDPATCHAPADARFPANQCPIKIRSHHHLRRSSAAESRVARIRPAPMIRHFDFGMPKSKCGMRNACVAMLPRRRPRRGKKGYVPIFRISITHQNPIPPRAMLQQMPGFRQTNARSKSDPTTCLAPAGAESR